VTQKEAEEILSAAGWVIYRELSAYRTWIYPGTRILTDAWDESVLELANHAWANRSNEANKRNLAGILPDMLLPKEIADVLKHCC
jgi:hypothetical protein